MNKIAPEDAFLILAKWFEERSFLHFESFNANTGKAFSCWALITRISEGKSIVFSRMELPFEFFRISFKPTLEFEHDESDGRPPFPSDPPLKWLRCLRLTWTDSGDTLLLAEINRENIHDILD
ncbi:MAG: hypothetical protein ACRD59_13145 [Candidatus Acidiferrales bacterium]